MQTFIERLQELPEEKQDKYAAMYLEELEADQRWETLFEQTTEEQWKGLVEEAQTETKNEETVPLDQFLDAQES